MKLKDKKIELLAVRNVKDKDGFSTETLTPICPPVWAYYRQLSGKEIYTNAAAAVPVEEAQFVINYRTDITTYDVIRFRGQLYNIIRVDTFEGYKEDLTVFVKKRSG